MIRYISLAKPPRPRADWWDDPEHRPHTMNVICEDDTPIDTGLLDSAGVKIYRVPGREKMGFR